MAGYLQRCIVIGMVVLLSAAGARGIGRAQDDGPLVRYNTPVVVTLNAGAVVTRGFLVLPGDSFEVRLARLAEITYSALLVDPDGNPLPLLPGPDGNIAFPVANVLRGGLYLLVIQAAAGGGEMLMEVGSTALEPLALAPGQTQVTLVGQALRYRLTPPAGAAGPVLLALDASPESGLPPVMLIDETAGSVLLDLPQGGLTHLALSVPAQGTFVLAFGPGVTTQVAITWGAALAAAPTASPMPTPTAPLPAPTASEATAPAEGTGQQAPQDARFNNPLAIPLDGTAATADVVSYPGGDAEDRIQFEVSGLNPSPGQPGGRALLVITAACSGTGIENIRFSSGGQTFACGQTVVSREVTIDSRSGSVIITAVGGQETYVGWTLNGTVTRVN